jgi:serine phosphatase RsbU (regulator of sigma subunit)
VDLPKTSVEEPSFQSPGTLHSIEQSSTSFGSQRFLRVYCLLCAITYPTWSIALKFSGSEDFPLLAGRLIIGLLWIFLYLASEFSRHVSNSLGILAYVLSGIMLAHAGYVMICADNHEIHGMMFIVLAITATALCIRVWQSAFLFFESLLIILAFAWFTDVPTDIVSMLAVCITVLSVFSMVMLNSRLSSLSIAAKSQYNLSLLQHRIVMQDMETAKCLQEALLKEWIDAPNVNAGSFYRSASKVGGDWYGAFYDAESKNLYFWTGDVTGHGVAAALMTGVVYGALYGGEMRTGNMNVLSVEERLLSMNRVLNSLLFELGSKSQKVMTLFSGALHVETGELHYVNAGHNFPWIVDKNKVSSLVHAGEPLGMYAHATAQVARKNLQPGSKIFCFTDGLLENPGGHKHAVIPKRAMRGLLLAEGHSMQDVLRKVEHYFAKTDLADDVTILFIEWKGVAGGPAGGREQVVS